MPYQNIAVYEEDSSNAESLVSCEGSDTSQSEEETTSKTKPLIEIIKDI